MTHPSMTAHHVADTCIHVVVGILKRPVSTFPAGALTADEYCVGFRDHGLVKGFWEFPGGKVESGESNTQALNRELMEEIGVKVIQSRLLLTINTPSGAQKDKTVRLLVYEVTAWDGEPYGAEGQLIQWQQLTWQDRSRFLPANRHMFTALCLGEYLQILNLKSVAQEQLLADIAAVVKINKALHGQLALRLRANGLTAPIYYEQVAVMLDLLTQHSLAAGKIRCFADVLPDQAFFKSNVWQNTNVGAYFPSWWQQESEKLAKFLMHLDHQPQVILRGVSCHSADELQWACSEPTGPQAHFYCLSPILTTKSHPAHPGLGWCRWSMLNQIHSQLGYALGGLNLEAIEQVKANGGFGLAGITAFNESMKGKEPVVESSI